MKTNLNSHPHFRQMEFEETILEDLALLDIHGDAVSHTSDYFDQLYDYAIQMIKSGKAYADDTEQTQVGSRCTCGVRLLIQSLLDASRALGRYRVQAPR